MCYKVCVIKKCFFIVLLYFSIGSIQAQAKITAPADVCIGNLAYFSSGNNSGVKSYRWEFGDGFTSVSKDPFHLYKQSGTYKVRLTVRLNDNNLTTDSAILVVNELPQAILFRDGPQDSCLYTNLFSFRDQSVPAKSGQDIEKRLILWGDGDFDISTNRGFDDLLQHHYKLKDLYPVKMEITDNKGCKSTVTSTVKVINGTKAKIKATISYPSCGIAEVCFSNESMTSNGSLQKHIWNFDSTGFKDLPYNNNTCVRSDSSKYARAYLLLSNPDNTCRSEAYVRVYLDADKIDNKMSASDTGICYGSSTPLEFSNSGLGYTYMWTLNGEYFSNAKDLSITPKSSDLMPGNYTLRCEVSKGSCMVSHATQFSVWGPVARMSIFNRKQCEIDARVFFTDASQFLDKQHAVYKWTVIDPEGENCVIDRARDINKYKNCNTTNGWFGKHDYTVPRGSNPILLEVRDTVTGCSDSIRDFMRHFCCRLCQRKDGPVSICQYDTFLPLEKDETGPKFFSLDTGKTWLKFPNEVPKPYKGLYGVSFIFEDRIPARAEDFGDDSIKLYIDTNVYRDTIFASDFLYVKEAKSTEMTVETYNLCQPYLAVIRLKDSIFHAGDIVLIDWKDDSTEEIHCKKDTIIDAFRHYYKLPGIDTTIDLTLTSAEACTRFKKLKIQFGKIYELEQTGNPCKNTEICFEPVILKTFNNTRLTAFKDIAWKTDSPALVKRSRLCQTYMLPGKKTIALITEDSLGCIDTLEKKFLIREIKAGVKDDTRTFYCSELKQLFDSSFHTVKDSNDYIFDYFWDFGSAMYTTTEKDPFRSFDLADSLVHVMHVAIDNMGCTDTFSFDIRIIGSLPRIEFTDTMGCAPFKTVFINKSKKCSSYIWEFDDDYNTTFENQDYLDVGFTYEKPGKYYPKLIGIDTFYNAYTGSVYYCHTTYDPHQAITVSKTLHSTLEGDDTVCLGQVAYFTSRSDDVLFNNWDFGDGITGRHSVGPGRVAHTYQRTGNFKLTVVPQFQFPAGMPVCLDSNTMNITVLGVEADFEIDDRSEAPIFYFNNKSQPSDADLLWNFDQPSSGNLNTSTEQNPKHNYGHDTKTFKVCLTASILNKCRDTTCKTLNNDYVQNLTLYNVFTPGNSDSLNDEYDVTIEGEHTYSLIIYDRWGVEVYRSDEDGQPGDGTNWNGKVYNMGAACPDGTYYYILYYSFKIEPDKEYKVNGTVTLIRQQD